jgi:hypothetical protein
MTVQLENLLAIKLMLSSEKISVFVQVKEEVI